MTSEVHQTPRAADDMVLVPGGWFRMGSDRFYPEERPCVEAEVAPLWVDVHPVTNRQFADFVTDTGHLTVAERPLDAADFPDADPDLLVPGSVVFTQTPGPVDLTDWTQWWRWEPGTSWRTPQGPGSDARDVLDHPVVHIGWEDATAYAAWRGAVLPTEAEWEHAARGGLVDQDYAWGAELSPGGRRMANTWTERFPWERPRDDPWPRTSPVGSFPANGYGLHDMIGNVWEWTSTRWTTKHRDAGTADDDETPSCCGGSVLHESDRRVTKGGSHLCSPSYCRRYRPAARQGHGVRDTTSHVGFRCVRRTSLQDQG